MNIAICDDQIFQIEVIKKALNSYILIHNEKNYSIDTYTNPFDLLDMIKKKLYDIILLDICMPLMQGIDVAKLIKTEKPLIQIIFLTTNTDYAIESYTVDATYYLLKPFSQKDFDIALNKAINNLPQEKSKTIIINLDDGAILQLEIDRIYYIESYHHSLILYLDDRKIVERKRSLEKMLIELNELEQNEFISPYRGYLVNQKNIRYIVTDKICMKNGAFIPIVHETLKE